jgi:hypothetical protein
MVRTWSVWLELGRDDGGSLSDEGIAELTELLTKDGLAPVVSRPDPGTVLVEMAVDARNDTEARGAAESALRDRASNVWLALGLPPFTIAFQEAHLQGDH